MTDIGQRSPLSSIQNTNIYSKEMISESCCITSFEKQIFICTGFFFLSLPFSMNIVYINMCI